MPGLCAHGAELKSPDFTVLARGPVRWAGGLRGIPDVDWGWGRRSVRLPQLPIHPLGSYTCVQSTLGFSRGARCASASAASWGLLLAAVMAWRLATTRKDTGATSRAEVAATAPPPPLSLLQPAAAVAAPRGQGRGAATAVAPAAADPVPGPGSSADAVAGGSSVGVDSGDEAASSSGVGGQARDWTFTRTTQFGRASFDVPMAAAVPGGSGGRLLSISQARPHLSTSASVPPPPPPSQLGLNSPFIDTPSTSLADAGDGHIASPDLRALFLVLVNTASRPSQLPPRLRTPLLQPHPSSRRPAALATALRLALEAASATFWTSPPADYDTGTGVVATDTFAGGGAVGSSSGGGSGSSGLGGSRSGDGGMGYVDDLLDDAAAARRLAAANRQAQQVAALERAAAPGWVWAVAEPGSPPLPTGFDPSLTQHPPLGYSSCQP
eukprot:XP_001694039.1 predicted protein [Chlamydomonas reinhardtii]